MFKHKREKYGFLARGCFELIVVGRRGLFFGVALSRVNILEPVAVILMMSDGMLYLVRGKRG